MKNAVDRITIPFGLSTTNVTQVFSELLYSGGEKSNAGKTDNVTTCPGKIYDVEGILIKNPKLDERLEEFSVIGC